jgi:rubrerythrin
MSDRFVWSCLDCTNAVVAGVTPPARETCPACGARDDSTPVESLWSRAGQIG